MSLFKIDNVRFSSSTQEIIKGVSFSIEKGSVVGILGKSGSGKSTLLKIAAGILSPTSGRVLFENRDIHLMTKIENKKFRKLCAFVFQDAALWENQTIEQNIGLPIQSQNQDISTAEIKSRIEKICSIVGYTRSLSLRPVDLSMGEQKLVALARALINDPEILFLDECMEWLDDKEMDRIFDIISKFVASGNTVAYVAHRSDFINFMMDLGMKFGGSVIYDIDGGLLKGADDYEI